MSHSFSGGLPARLALLFCLFTLPLPALADGTVTGRITDAGTGQGVASMGICLVPSSLGPDWVCGNSDANGDYSIDEVPNGDWYAFVSGDATRYVAEIWPDTYNFGDRAGATWFTVNDDTVENIDFSLDEGTTLAGQVTLEGSGNGIGDVSICILQRDPDNPPFYRQSNLCVTSDSDGHYRTTGIPEFASDYVIRAADDAGIYEWQLFDGVACPNKECDYLQGTHVALGEEDVTGIDFSIAEFAPSGGAISGTVTDSITGLGIEYVRIAILDEDCFWVDNQLAETDSTGRYLVGALPDGAYSVHATGDHLGYINESYDNVPDYTGCLDGTGEPQRLTVSDGELRDGIDFALDRGASISGRVTDANGNPPPSWAQVRLYTPDGTQLNVFGSNEEGEYFAGGLRAGSYQLVHSVNRTNLIDERYNNIKCPRNACDDGLGEVITLSSEEAIDNINAQLDPGGRIRGRVTDAATGDGLAVCVAFYDIQGRYADFACTQDDGSFESSHGLPNGQYLLSNQFFINDYANPDLGYTPQVWKADGSFGACGSPCDFTRGDLIRVNGLGGVDGIEFQLQRGGSISGRVTGPDGSIEGTAIELLNADTAEVLRTVTADFVGNYTIGGVSAGAYRVRTRNDLGYGDELYAEDGNVACNPYCDPYSGSTLVLDQDEDRSGIDFQLQVAASLSGRVTGPGGTRLADITVEAWNTAGNFEAAAITDSNGDYTIAGLGQGLYYLRTRNTAGYANKAWMNQPCPGECNLARTSLVDFLAEGEQRHNMDFALRRGGTVSGLVYAEDDNGDLQPLAGVPVTAFSSDGRVAAEAESDANGAYAITGLSNGQYWVLAEDRAGDFQPLGANGQGCARPCENPVGTLDPVTVTEGQDTGVDFDFQRARSLWILVTDKGGRKQASITLNLFDETGRRVASSSSRGTNFEDRMVAGDANAVLFGITPGRYYLTSSNVLGFRDQAYESLDCTGGCNPLEGTAIDVGPPQGRAVTIALERGFAISGRAQPTGVADGIGGVQMALYQGAQLMEHTFTDAEGRFSFEGVGNGSGYRVITGGDHGYINRVYGGDACSPGACDVLSGSEIVVDSDDVSGINFRLNPGNILSGYADDPDGNIVFGTAMLFSAAGEQVQTQQVAGEFTFYGLAEGTYYLWIKAHIQEVGEDEACHQHTEIDGSSIEHCVPVGSFSSAIDTLYDGTPCFDARCDITSGTPIIIGAESRLQRVADAKTKNDAIIGAYRLNMAMDAGYSISGSMKDYLNNGLFYQRVYLFDSNGNPAGSTLTDAEGNWEINSGLPNGEYYVATSREADDFDDPLEAWDAENRQPEELLGQVYGGGDCQGPCDPGGADGGTPVRINDSSTPDIDLSLAQAPKVDIVTRVNGVQADSLNGGLAPEFPAGTPLSWTYEVSNSGAGRLRNIQVEDERGLAVTCPRAALDPGQDMTCTAESLAEDISASPDRTAGNCSGVPGVDLLPGGAKVTARTALESNIDASDPAYYCNDSGRFRINAGLNDAWFNPATAGQGFFINVFEDLGLMFLAWFTFDAERPAGDVDSVLGDPGHRWLTAFGPYDGDEALLAIESTTGGVFNQAEPKPDQAPDGFIRVSFESCSEATVGYQIDSAKRESGIPLIRILNDNVPACEERASAPPEARAQVRKPDIRPASDGFQMGPGLNDAWWDPAKGGQGFFINVYPETGLVFLSWFTYDTERPDDDTPSRLGDPGHRWLTAFGSFDGNRAELDVEMTTGGILDSGDPKPDQAKDGSMVLEFTGCNAGTVTYDIPSADVSGTVDIQRVALDNVDDCEAEQAEVR